MDLARHQRSVLDATIAVANEPLGTIRIGFTALLEQVDAPAALTRLTAVSGTITIREALQTAPIEEAPPELLTPRLRVRAKIAEHTCRRRARLTTLDHTVDVLEALEALTRHRIAVGQARGARLLARAVSGRLAAPARAALSGVTFIRIIALAATELAITPAATGACLAEFTRGHAARQRQLARLAQGALGVLLAHIRGRSAERMCAEAHLASVTIRASLAKTHDAIALEASCALITISVFLTYGQAADALDASRTSRARARARAGDLGALTARAGELGGRRAVEDVRARISRHGIRLVARVRARGHKQRADKTAHEHQ